MGIAEYALSASTFNPISFFSVDLNTGVTSFANLSDKRNRTEAPANKELSLCRRLSSGRLDLK